MAMTISQLNEEIRNCRKCGLSETRKNALCGEGRPGSRIMLIAQAPGEKENAEGRMFIGPSGHVLDDLLVTASVRREDIYMTNLVKCMLPDYRKPKQDEIEACSSYLDREIQLVDPQFLVPLGYYASRYVFRKHGFDVTSRKGFRETYGQLFWTGKRKMLPLQHPAALLHDPSIEDVMRKNYRKLSVLKADCKWAVT
jgi:DNA polymerase